MLYNAIQEVIFFIAHCGISWSRMRRAVGLLHPGAMGQRIGSALVQAGNEVWWCGEGRSAASASRAAKIGLKDAGSLPNLVEKCKVIVCLCPPVSALPVAQSVFASGFQGMYCDANALVPDDALKVGVSSMHLLSFTEFTSFIVDWNQCHANRCLLFCLQTLSSR
jgi:hypothetical protein